MTAAELDIIIGANTDQAIAAFKKLGYSITQTEQKAAKASGKMGKDFTGLSRVIQDLPFGFTAIQNNITQLVPAAGGLGVAIAVITSAITFAQIGFSNWTRGLGQTKEQLDEVNKSVAGAQTEIVKVSSLLSIARGLGESTQARKNAIAELQKEYPGYLANLNLENINSQETANAIELLSDALTRKAKVQAVSNLLTKANEKLLSAQNATIADNILSVNAFLGLLKRAGSGFGGVGIFEGATKETVGNLAEANEEVRALSNTLAELTQEQARNNEFSLLNPTTPKKLKKVAEGFAQINAFIKGRSKFDNVIAIETGRFINNQIQKGLDSGPPLKIPNFDFNKTDLAQKIAAATETIRQTLESALEGVGEALGNLLSGKKNPFSNIYSVIGEGLKALGKQLIIVGELAQIVQKALANIFTNPGLAIAVGIAAIAIGTAISNMANKGIQAFATGGVVTSPTLALVGEQGPERITPLGYENSANNNWNGKVEFIIQGQVLRGILKRADQTAFYTT